MIVLEVWAAELARQCGTTVEQAQAVLDGAEMAIEPSSLYVTEDQLAKVVLGTGNLAEWRKIAAALELEGLPKADPLVGKRFWPAVSVWLRQRHGLAEGPTPGVDGEENWT